MRKLLFLLLFPLAMHSQGAPKDGTYANKSEIVYEIDIKGDNIIFYVKENESDKPDHKMSSRGKIVSVKNKFFVENITGDKVSDRKQEKLELKVKDNSIEFKSYNLLNSFYQQFSIFSNKIEYQLQLN